MKGYTELILEDLALSGRVDMLGRAGTVEKRMREETGGCLDAVSRRRFRSLVGVAVEIMDESLRAAANEADPYMRSVYMRLAGRDDSGFDDCPKCGEAM